MTKKQFLLPLLLMSTFFATQAMALDACKSGKEMKETVPCYLGTYEKAINGGYIKGYDPEVKFSHDDQNIVLTLKNNTTLPLSMSISYYHNCTTEQPATMVTNDFILPAGSENSPSVTHKVIQSNCTMTWVKEHLSYSAPEYPNIAVVSNSQDAKNSSVLDEIDLYGEEY